MRLRNYAIGLFLGLLLVACGKPQPYQQQAFVFGTLVEISISGVPDEQAKTASQAVLARFDQLHRKLHPWQPSALSQLNSAFAHGEPVPADAELAAMLRDAEAIAVRSGHLFNPAIGGLIALWGFHSDTPQSGVPDPGEVARWVRLNPRMSDIHIENDTIWSSNPAVQVDLGGYAKGVALDEAARILQENGIRDALVNIGGNIIALGRNGDRPWRVGIQHPRKAGTLAMLDLHDGEAVGTSGDYQRYFEVEGKRYHHLIDPHSGYPSEGMQSVTVLLAGERAGVRSDALSKPLFIAGADQLEETARRNGVEHYLAVEAAGALRVSPALASRLR
ncbi:MAG: FAD:protein FMN transferase [Thiobacillaceae bacterium]|jgi:thiamine biosynthesis lipoprotein|nr:FAD:protein FMN transferase [Thiobacillaceae bacterium]